ncbi:MAG: 4Fe-4S dicluster domain-containing protein [Candidatus Eremiobacterota bacterium]
MAEDPKDQFRTSIQDVGKVQWGMVVDVDRCTGCKACVVACRSENNVQVVGPDQAAMGRLMDWIRVDRYWDDEHHEVIGYGRLKEQQEPHHDDSHEGYPNVRATFVPMMCQHCSTAPCEPVCPVFAAVHTNDGLNAQIYNRCVGTRPCGINCAYRVRVYNFFTPQWDAPLDQMLNPDVTVRSEGVMEKCTMCVQRIRRAEQDAKVARRHLEDGQLRTACAQACPTSAITFGNLKDPESAVSRLIRENSSRTHKVLNELLDTQPNVIYLRPEHVPDAL